MTDQLELLHDARPTQDDLARLWPDEHRDRVLQSVLDQTRPSKTRPSRRGRRLVAVAAAAATAIAVVPHLLSGGDAQAHEELRRLAVVATKSDLPVITPGHYLHIVSSSVQHNGAGSTDPGTTYRVNREEWDRWDGTVSIIDTAHHRGGLQEYDRLAPTKDDVGAPTPQFAASLPTSADELYAYLDTHVHGDESHNYAMFDAVTTVMYSQFVTPKLLGALLGVLARIDHVSTDDVTVAGRPAVRISYRNHGTETITVDRATAHMIGYTETSQSARYEDTIVSVEVVDAIPAPVAKIFNEHPNGYSVCPDGSTPTSDGDC